MRMHVLEFCTSNFTFITMRSSVNSTLFVSFNEIIAPPIQDSLAIPETHRFTYDELKAITNNFDLVLGKGGFGNVYHGRLHDGTEAAVKLLHSHRMVKGTSSEESMSANSGSRSHGLKEFLAEVCNLYECILVD